MKILITEMQPYILAFEVKDMKEAKELIKNFKGYNTTIHIEVYDGEKVIYTITKKPIIEK